MVTGGGGGHPFLSGYATAGHLFAERLRARAGEVAIGRRVARLAPGGSWQVVEAARTPFESDAKAVVATMRARGDRGDYEVSEWS